ncbi:nucleolar pre-ribosomal-associated protein 1 [[Emmonsia] crescens]|uniref:Nucleolar pre-ribosomal-associated protein 1 n=1 Tax=[Emmonsia] crescens TaxID=73230 RepID=A0A2B7ZR52_9EURO|nr:nucleolar pre-ribosomal-associated protein 1 [Emmonsia crescens]
MAHFQEDTSRAKRRKIDVDFSTTPKPAVIITSHTQLRNLLAFQQSASQEVKQGVRYFKDFLASINEAEKENEKAKKLRILKAYCDSQLVNAGDEAQASCFHDLLQTWNFAESDNHESLLSLIPSVLALFLKTISSQLEFRDFGLVLCKFLLQKEQLKLFNRAFTASKTKEHLISPCIRLLTEIVGFDGGAVARLVYGRREITFKRLDLFLSVRKSPADIDSEDRQKSTLRRNAQRYLLANLKFQNATAKEDIIGQGKLIRTFLEDIRKDSRDIVIDIIRAIDKYIASDSSLSRNVKSRFLNRHNLERLVTLYGYEKESDEPVVNEESVSKEIHKLLLAICTNSEKGVLLPETGWYPTGNNPDVLPLNDDSAIPLGLDSPAHFDKYKESVPVRNGNLSALIQFLRPDSDTLQMELLLKIFRAAPELVFDFFSKRTMFTSDPKPTPSWLGESAFLFSTIQLPVPANCGWKGNPALVPPPVFVAIESILPRPLTQKILTRCLNQNTDVITLFAVRIITRALHKLQTVLQIFNADRETGQELWAQAAGKLVDEFCRRCPSMKDIILLFRNTTTDNLQQQDAVLELLSMFYRVIPTVALEEKFDISLTLVDVLKQLNNGDSQPEDKELLFSQLQNLLVIAQQSPTMRWWQKPESLQFSAFVSVFKVLTEATSDQAPLEDIRSLVQDVLIQNSVILSPASFNALLSSIDTSDSVTLATQLSFLDNCITRLVKKPVLYLDLVQSLVGDGQENLSLLVGVISEQWPFVVKSGQSDKQVVVSSWISRLLGLLNVVGEDEKALKAVRDAVIDNMENKKVRSALKKAFKHAKEAGEQNDNGHTLVTANGSSKSESQIQASRVDLTEMFGALPVESESRPVLNRWEREEIELTLEKGHIGELMLCLCSEYEEIRRQANAAISRFMVKIRESTYEESQSIYIVAGEVLETAKEVGLKTPLPYIAGELAARMVMVLTDPLHKLYGKVNKFLNKGPRWEVAKIPSYWIDKILLHESEYDDSYHEEVGWLLGLFINGLRTKKDMDLYRRANVFERVLSLYNSPGLPDPLRRTILHLMFRACEVGGSTTILTRNGALSWIQGQVSVQDNQSDILRAIGSELYNKCDHEWIDRWSGSSLPQVVAQISG